MLDEEGEQRRSADRLELAGVSQCLAERDEVHRLAPVAKALHRGEDDAVGLEEEVRGLQHLGEARQRLPPLEEHRAEDGPLGIEVVGRDGEGGHHGDHHISLLSGGGHLLPSTVGPPVAASTTYR